MRKSENLFLFSDFIKNKKIIRCDRKIAISQRYTKYTQILYIYNKSIKIFYILKNKEKIKKNKNIYKKKCSKSVPKCSKGVPKCSKVFQKYFSSFIKINN